MFLIFCRHCQLVDVQAGCSGSTSSGGSSNTKSCHWGPTASTQVNSLLLQPQKLQLCVNSRCSYLNTDFVGDDLDFDADNGRVGEGINAGSARACKARCRLEEACNFWTYKEGASRDLLTMDCFLKEGTPGLPVPREAVPRLGFVSGTRDNNCICIKSEDEEDEVCPIKDPRGLVYPWRSLDDEENDLEKGLPPLGWNRGVYGALDPRLTPIVGDNLSSIGGNNLLESQVSAGPPIEIHM